MDKETMTSKILIKSGVRREDTIFTKLFTLTLEEIRNGLDCQDKGINIDGTRPNYSRFADDIVLISNSPEQLRKYNRRTTPCVIQDRTENKFNENKYNES